MMFWARLWSNCTMLMDQQLYSLKELPKGKLFRFPEHAAWLGEPGAQPE